MRRPLLEAVEPHPRERPRDPFPHLLLADAELLRAEGDVLEHGRAEELVVGVLEEEADLAADLVEVAG